MSKFLIRKTEIYWVLSKKKNGVQPVTVYAFNGNKVYVVETGRGHFYHVKHDELYSSYYDCLKGSLLKFVQDE